MANIESGDVLARLLEEFDFPIAPDDFIFYEIHALIEEDRASFEDEAFRRAIDEGISEHVEERTDVRAAIALRLRRALPRLDEGTRRIALRTIRTLEDMNAVLASVSLIVRAFTADVFRKLEEPSPSSETLQNEAEKWIERWSQGEILREQMMSRLKEIGRPAVGPLADMLFNDPEDRMASEAAIVTLGAIPCSSSARVLAHAIAEPLLAEDLEIQAYSQAKRLWPLQRHFMLYTLAPHDHEDIPFRWYELLIDCDELQVVDRILDELLTHGGEPEYREDLLALLELLRRAGDPDTEEKIVGLLNSPDTAIEAKGILEAFLGGFHSRKPSSGNPWVRAAQLEDLNRKYLAAARLYERERRAEALTELEAILKEEPGYPFAESLKQLI